MRTHIDINVDMGEGIGNESRLMPLISSCNIACGGHAGNAESMHKVAVLAKAHKVKIGAHPSFPDKANFGRKVMDMPCVALYASIKNQIKSLIEVLQGLHVNLHHVKPHGALYNLAAIDERIANTIIEVMKSPMLQAKPLYVPYNSVIANLAIKNNVPVTYEAFADRNYNDDLTLVSRTAPHALIEDADAMFSQVYTMFSKAQVKTITGHYKNITAETFCIHGDNPKAVKLLKKLVKRLGLQGVKVR